jgi:DNA repair protein RadA/Sms
MAFTCRSCGFSTGKWMGFCPQCRSQGALVAVMGATGAAPVPVAEAAATTAAPRRVSGMGEADRVLGGGLVVGSVVLLGGEPGVGKSTLLLHLAAAVASEQRVLYVSGEESVRQIGIRADRIEAMRPELLVMAETDVGAVEDAVDDVQPSLLVVDSVQTCRVAEADGAPGGVTQVRASGARLAALARRTGIPVVLVGHVTKDGALAGPKVLEHLVDVVLYLEGDPDRGLRYLRSLKNRYGSVDQVGVFEMTERGLAEVTDPTGVFVGDWTGGVPGTVLYPGLYGRRSLLFEVQALVAPSSTPQPRRSVKGVEPARVHQIVAVLERHAGVSCAEHDIYVNVVGGLTLRDPAADLPVALAIASSRLGLPVGAVAAFGEIGLAGEVRAVPHEERRRREAERFSVGRLVTGGGARRIDAALATAGLHTQRVTGNGPSQRKPVLEGAT